MEVKELHFYTVLVIYAIEHLPDDNIKGATLAVGVLAHDEAEALAMVKAASSDYDIQDIHVMPPETQPRILFQTPATPQFETRRRDV